MGAFCDYAFTFAQTAGYGVGNQGYLFCCAGTVTFLTLGVCVVVNPSGFFTLCYFAD